MWLGFNVGYINGEEMSTKISKTHRDQVSELFDDGLINARHLCYALCKSYHVFQMQITRMGFEIRTEDRAFNTSKGGMFVRPCVMITNEQAVLYVHRFDKGYSSRVTQLLLTKPLKDINIYEVVR